jgi:hypothetical protein
VLGDEEGEAGALSARLRAVESERIPSLANASVRAMITKVGSVRAATHERMRSTISASETISLPGRCPQRLAAT